MSHGLDDNFEQRILREANAILRSRAADFARLGLRVEMIGLQRHGTKTELTVYFWRDDKLVDAIEFFVTEGGAPAASDEEIRLWLEEQIESVVNR